MRKTMTFEIEGGSSYRWDLTLDEWLAILPEMGALLGAPVVTPRCGEIGEPQRRINVEPVTEPAEIPEPIAVPEREPVPV